MTAFFQKQWVKRTVCILLVLYLVVVLGGGALVVYSYFQNQIITVTHYAVSHAQIPASFEGKRIVQLTDLHNHDFGDDLTALVKAQHPDILVITGDWISRNDTDITVAKRQATALAGIAPTYYVAGNHEAESPLAGDLFALFDSLGFILLDSAAAEWREGTDSVQLVGMYDPEFSTHLWRDMAPLVDEEKYTVLLFHRPEYLEDAAAFGADLILSGHTHGGQIRLPLIGAMYVSDQGFFPRYVVGRYDHGDTAMIVCQGLGEGTFMRVLTPPEICVITLDSPVV